MSDSISVAVRVRPLNQREIDGGAGTTWLVEDNTITQCASSGKPIPEASYSFDKIFNTGIKTQEVYNSIAKDIVLQAMEGFNGTIFAYGQTSSGKTHTMMGYPGEPGIIPLAVREVFDYIDGVENMEFLLRVSCMEIYNETITDLLDTSKTNLKIKENHDGDVYVGDLTETAVGSPDAVMQLLNEGLGERHVAATKMNDTSSRSHTVFRIVIESRHIRPSTDETSDDATAPEVVDDGAIRVAQLNLVDLAGSERVAHTGAAGERLKEAGNINKSLLTLGSVIGKLAEAGNKDRAHIPYRDSKLTRILQNSLGGNAKTAIICAVTPATAHVEESLSSLKFSNRAKNIKNNAKVNEVLDEATQMKRYKRMIADLEREVSALKTGDVVETLQTEKAQLSEALTQQERMFRDQQSEVARLKSLIMIGGSSPRKALLGVGGRGEEDEDGSGTRAASGKRPSRRETWCPGAAARTRRSARRSIAMNTAAVPHSKKPRRVSTMPSAANADGGAAKITSRSRRDRRSVVPSFDMLSSAPDAHAANVAALEEKLSAKESIISQLNSQLEESNQNFENFMIRSTTQTKKSAQEIETLKATVDNLQKQLELAMNKETIVNQSCDAELQRVKENEEFMKAELEVLQSAASDVEADYAKRMERLVSPSKVQAATKTLEDRIATMEADAVRVATEHKELVTFLEDTIQKLQSSGSGSKVLTDAAQEEQDKAAAEEQAKLNTALATVADLESKLLTATTEATDAKTDVVDLQSRLDVATTRIADMQSQLDASIRTAADKETQASELQTQVATATDDAEAALAKVAAVQAQLDAVTEQQAAAAEELAMWKESAGTAIAAQEAAERQLNELTASTRADADMASELETLREQLASVHSAHAETLHAAAEQHDAELASQLQKCREDHGTQVQGLHAEVAEARSALAASETAAQQAVEDLRSKVSKMSVEMEMVQDDKDYVEQQVQKLTATVGSLERALEDATDKLARVESLEKDVEKQCTEQQLLIDALTEEKAALTSQLQETASAQDSASSTLQTKLQQLEEALNAKTTEATSQAASVTEYKAQLERVETTLADKDALLAAQTAECTALQSKLEQMEQALAGKDLAIASHTEEISELRTRCEAFDNDMATKETQLTAHFAESAALQARVDQMQQALDTQANNETASQTAEHTALRAQIEQLEQTIAAHATDAEQRTDLQARYDAIVDARDRAVHEASKQHAVLSALVTEADATADTAMENLHAEKELTATLKTQLAAAMADIDRLCIDLEEAQEVASCEQDFLATALHEQTTATTPAVDDEGQRAEIARLTHELQQAKDDMAAVVRAAAVAKEASAEQLEASKACVAQLHVQTAELQAQVEILTIATSGGAPAAAAAADDEYDSNADSSGPSSPPVSSHNIADDLAAMPTPKRRKFLSMMKSPFVKKDKERAKPKGGNKKRKLFKKGTMMDSPYVDEAVVTHARVEKLLTPAPRFVLTDEALASDAPDTAMAKKAFEVPADARDSALQQHLREAISERDALRRDMAQQQQQIAALEVQVQEATAAAAAAATLAERPSTQEAAMQTEGAAETSADLTDAAPSLFEELVQDTMADGAIDGTVDGITMAAKCEGAPVVSTTAPPTPVAPTDAAVVDVEQLRTELATARATLAALQSEFDTLQDEHLEGLEVQEFLQGQVDEGKGLRAQLDAAQQQRMDDLEEKRQCHDTIAALRSEVDTLTAAGAEAAQHHTATVATLTADLDALRQTNADVTAAMAVHEHTLQRVTADRDATQADLTILRGRYAGQEEACASATASTTALHDQVQTLSARLAAAEQATATAEAALATMEEAHTTQTEALAAQLAALTTTLEHGDTQLHELQEQRDAAVREVETLTAAHATLEASVATLTAAQREHPEIDALQSDIAALRTAAAAKAGELTQLQQALEEVCAENTALQESVTHARQTIATLQRTIADGKQALQTAQAQRTQAVDELAEAHIEIERLQEVQQGMADELVAAEDAAQQQVRAATSSLQGKIDALQQTLEQAQQQSSTDANEHIDALIELEGKYQSLESQHRALQDQHTAAVAQHETHCRQYTTLEEQHRDATKECKTLAAQMGKLQKKLKALREHSDNVDSLREQEVQELQGIITQQHVDKKRIETLQAEAAQSQQTAKALTKQIEQLKATAGGGRGGATGKPAAKSLREINLEAAIAQLQAKNKQLLDDLAMQQSSSAAAAASSKARSKKRELTQAKTGSHIVEQEVVESLQLENKAMKQQMERIRAASVSFNDDDGGASDTSLATAVDGHPGAPTSAVRGSTRSAPPPRPAPTTASPLMPPPAAAVPVAKQRVSKRPALKDVNRGNDSPAGATEPKPKAAGLHTKRVRENTDADVAAKVALGGGGRASKRHSPLHTLPSLKETSLMDADDDAAPECQTQ
eukprot:m.1402379 g.1402379  ORF g.1402379 m.1402379 type:complete len:2418 (+) comp25010_c0_seq3:94-7347(+)